MGESTILKAIFFDIDDTLFSTSEFAETARRNAARASSSWRFPAFSGNAFAISLRTSFA